MPGLPSRNSIILEQTALAFIKNRDPQFLVGLSEGLELKALDPSAFLFSEGQTAVACFVVASGSVKLIRTSPVGRQTVMCFCSPGDFIAAAIMNHPEPRYPVSAVANENCEVIMIPRLTFLHHWMKDPDISQAVTLNVMNRMREFHDDKMMTPHSVPERIAHFLLRQVRQGRQARTSESGFQLSGKLTRKDIAERVGTSAETVIRVLSQWRQRGWVKTGNQQISVLDPEALEKLLRPSGSDDETV